RKERAARLRNAGQRNLEKTLQSFVHQEINVLFESETQGHSEHFLMVEATLPQIPGSLMKARVLEAKEGHLIAEVLS
ncbi:MAG: tRNA (N(6)-L-threonylcarbamoyladenosine(37)-C(2))-methylthiotransferase MtaB, partial [Alphaproteobacteria bacterium]|nr:tRNA (N(6)-L-threonylcarbamoyladenosine(37)-C(2))-methylthiotransferase MtaB [Alphaproteobacteria bacterium]